ncbi:MAG: 2-phospho-L-lactate guanylyltransferase [Pseudomonadales bacterium]|jgi:2-phospho-L-lactate guanylyltransferase|nr:2-phospho-L-lactate guanylyltransferase [Acidiferrobacteraceae bacterium]MDP6375463.1 2-phospho-L-lactate guanylyltransferase [Pseudomonadales bacterium]MDP6470632.1 2-phospho-L-lactate guanylyltransferase [Pseudomonadales bacterium]MDP6828512.1 2-phospho-L-lactate guanylyltransferase [Pseudomonadales bacterium]MDP6970503.1 2-phospho-L-lactate guanylyltransferase [Pseudomonadales bacterium]|tara:strand:+ start:2423 stop:3109 length:687 start_codon:yes stop_codon:yes gene_type:complete
MWAIVPIKSFEFAKKRLANLLSPDERRLLMLAMARDVLTALSRSQRLSGVLIVSRAPEADALAQSFGTERFAEAPDADLPSALTQAAEYLAERLNAKGVFIVPADVPLIRASEIDAVLDEHEIVTIIPDDEHIGTNGLLTSPPDAIAFIFDGKSFRPHVDAAYRAGITPLIKPCTGFAVDIDLPADLEILLREGPGTQTSTYLERAGIAERLASRARTAGEENQDKSD